MSPFYRWVRRGSLLPRSLGSPLCERPNAFFFCFSFPVAIGPPIFFCFNISQQPPRKTTFGPQSPYFCPWASSPFFFAPLSSSKISSTDFVTPDSFTVFLPMGPFPAPLSSRRPIRFLIATTLFQGFWSATFFFSLLSRAFSPHAGFQLRLSEVFWQFLYLVPLSNSRLQPFSTGPLTSLLASEMRVRQRFGPPPPISLFSPPA